jgi:glycosyltransferase involved in cell wall biosynthesis
MRDTARGKMARAYFGGQWRRMLHFERTAAAGFDGVIGVSDEDCKIMRDELGLKNVLGSVPTGVDADFFQAGTVPKKPRSVVFLGSMDWMPNIDAVVYFVEAIFPEIKKNAPDVSFTIVGRNPPGSIRSLAEKDPAIRVTGTVPDVRAYVAEAEVVVVPLRVGGGTRIKIFEAMAAGIPVVSTAIGAEGLPVRHGEEVLLADTPGAFADAVVRLLREPPLREKIGRNGLDLVHEKFGWAPVVKVFENYCSKLLTSLP